MRAQSAFAGGSGNQGSPVVVEDDQTPGAGPSRPRQAELPISEASSTLRAHVGVVEEEELDAASMKWLRDRGLMPEDFETDYGLLAPEDTVIVRPYGGEDDDILLQELRPRFVVMYEPNLPFIRRLEVTFRLNIQ